MRLAGSIVLRIVALLLAALASTGALAYRSKPFQPPQIASPATLGPNALDNP